MFELEKTIKDVLNKMQNVAPTVVSGGYLRDKVLGIPPNDVDILTEMGITDLQQLYPQLQGTERGLNFGVGRFSLQGVSFEVTCLSGACIADVIPKKDFILNSLFHDGERLHDMFGALDDISKKRIRTLEKPTVHFARSPQAYIRAIRLAGQLGFELDSDLLAFLQSNKHFFYENNDSRIQQEGHKIIRTRYPLRSFECLSRIDLLPLTQQLSVSPLASVPNIEDKVYIRLLLLSEFVGMDYIHSFIDFFQLTAQLKEQMHPLIPYLATDEIPTKPHLLNKVIVLKRMQYDKQPEKFKRYMELIRSRPMK